MTGPREAVDRAAESVEEALEGIALLERELVSARPAGGAPDPRHQARLSELGAECARLRAEARAAADTLRRREEDQSRLLSELHGLRERVRALEIDLRRRGEQAAAEAAQLRLEAETARAIAEEANRECDTLAGENGALRARVQALQAEPANAAALAIENELRERERAARSALEREQQRRAAVEAERTRAEAERARADADRAQAEARAAAQEQGRAAAERARDEALRTIEALRAAAVPASAGPSDLDAAIDALVPLLESARLGLQSLAQSAKAKSLLGGIGTVQEHLRSLREYYRDPPPAGTEDPGPVIDLVLRAWTPALKRRSIAVHRTGAPGARCRIQPERLRLAAYQLVKNAYEAMPRGGRLELSVESRDGWTLVRVADSGPGFPAWVLEAPARPFRGRSPGRLGLGLALAARIASRAGGALRAENRPEGGALVELRLPADSPHPSPLQPKAGEGGKR